MEIIETNFRRIPEGFEHRVQFIFEKREFVALVIETKDETYIRDCYFVEQQLVPIDIPKYFGEYKSDVYYFIYANMTKGFPVDDVGDGVNVEPENNIVE